jgi:hypothetical protein
MPRAPWRARSSERVPIHVMRIGRPARRVISSSLRRRTSHVPRPTVPNPIRRLVHHREVPRTAPEFGSRYPCFRRPTPAAHVGRTINQRSVRIGTHRTHGRIVEDVPERRIGHTLRVAELGANPRDLGDVGERRRLDLKLADGSVIEKAARFPKDRFADQQLVGLRCFLDARGEVHRVAPHVEPQSSAALGAGRAGVDDAARGGSQADSHPRLP